MAALDETALICDFAEVYHVLDWRQLPVFTAAALAAGLGPNSRIARKNTGAPVGVDTMLLAMITDALHVLAWQNTKDGAKGRNRPKSILQQILGGEKKAQETSGFDTPEDYEAWRAAMTEEG